VLEELCALHPQSSGGIRGSANDSVRILGKVESQDPKFQKKYLKLINEEPTLVMPKEMEKLVSELPRGAEIVALLKRISDECMIARPDAAIDPLVIASIPTRPALSSNDSPPVFICRKRQPRAISSPNSSASIIANPWRG
jgi:hypothetical protein